MLTFYENKSEDFFHRQGQHLGFSAHLHKHIELVYMLEGRSLTCVDGNDSYLEPGDLFITFPNQIHSYETYAKEKYHIFIFSFDLVPEYKKLFTHKIPKTQVLKNASKDAFLVSLIKEMANISLDETLYSKTELRGYLLVVLSKLFKILPLKQNAPSDLTTIQKILTYCQQNYKKHLTLDDAAKDLHISKYHISHLIKEKVHTGYTDFINGIRISEACHLLTTTDLSITNISYQVGFKTTRTFNRSFIKHIKKSPTKYRNSFVNKKAAST